MRIRGEGAIKWSESKRLWRCVIDLGYKPDGSRHRVELTAKSKNALIDKRRDKIREIEDGTYTSGRVPTVSAWWTHWCDTVAFQRVRPTTLDNYRSYGRVHIPHIGKRKLDKLTVDDVRHLHQKMREGGASDRTVQAVHNTLSKAMKDAVREGIIRQNPCDRMDRPKANSDERGAYSLAEARAIITTAKGDGPRWESRWLMALMLGARQAECLGLEWDRVDLTGGTVDVSWQVQRISWTHGPKCGCKAGTSAARCPHRVPDAPSHLDIRHCHAGVWFTRPKTAASVRHIPLPRPLLVALRAWREETTGTGLVWHDMGKPLLPRDDVKAWKELCGRAGVRALTLHSARHTMVTLLLDAGVDPEVIRQIAGHSTILSTRGYMHVSLEQARRALDVWD